MFFLFILLTFVPVQHADYLTITPERYVVELEPLLQWRSDHGCRTKIVTLDSIRKEEGGPVTPESIKNKIKETYEEEGGRLKYLLLVGDANETGVPPFLLKHYRWMRSDAEEMATDVPYGDMEGDFLPELTVGRLAVNSPEQLKVIVEKILRFEKAKLDPERRLKIVLFGGASGYAPAIDQFIETLSRTMLDSLLSPRYDLDVLYGNLKSLYCPPPDELGKRFAESFNEGPAFSIFMGHGSKKTCFGMTWQRGRRNIGYGLIPSDLSAIRPESASGPLFLFSCDNGFFDDKDPCLAEDFLLNSGGPVCVIASSRFSHPLTNLYSAQSLLESIDHCRTVGELVNQMKILGFGKNDLFTNTLLKDAEGSLEDPIDVVQLKKDQVYLFNLLGDPATRVEPPKEMKVEAVLLSDGQGMEVRATSPLEDSTGRVSLCHVRTWEPEQEILPDPEKRETEWRKLKTHLFDAVNDKEICTFSIKTKEGPLKERLSFEHPPEPGTYTVIVYLTDGREDAAGAATLVVPK